MPEEEVTKVLASWRDYFNGRLPDLLLGLYSKDATFFGTSKSGLHRGASEIRSYFPSTYEVSFREWDVIPVACDSLLVIGTYAFGRDQPGGQDELPARFSLVLRLDGGRLRILHHHSSLEPGD
ncbi:nuclear transport factor 2 family protein [Mesorhizobium sp.]